METFLYEARLFAARIGTLRSILLHLLLLAAFGIWIPRLKGVDFLDPEVLGAYACLGLLFAGPATAQSFGNDGRSSFQQAKARMLVGVLYGEGVVLALLGTGIATVYMMSRGGFLPRPDWMSLARSAALGFSASVMIAALAAWMSVRFSHRSAMICLRLLFFGLLVLFYYKGQALPEAGLTGAGACIAMASFLLELTRRACQ